MKFILDADNSQCNYYNVESCDSCSEPINIDIQVLPQCQWLIVIGDFRA